MGVYWSGFIHLEPCSLDIFVQGKQDLCKKTLATVTLRKHGRFICLIYSPSRNTLNNIKPLRSEGSQQLESILQNRGYILSTNLWKSAANAPSRVGENYLPTHKKAFPTSLPLHLVSPVVSASILYQHFIQQLWSENSGLIYLTQPSLCNLAWISAYSNDIT